MNYALYNQKYNFDVFDDTYIADDDGEEAWVYDPVVLVWPPANIFKVYPFERNVTPAERLNAHSRLTILIGLTMYYMMRQRSDGNLDSLSGLYILFWTLLFVVQQGVAYMNMEDVRFQASFQAPFQAPQINNPRVSVLAEVEYYKRLMLEANARAVANAQALQAVTQAQANVQIANANANANTNSIQQLRQQQIQLFPSPIL